MNTARYILTSLVLASSMLVLGTSVAKAGVGGGPFVSGFIEGGVNNDAISDIAQLPDGDFVVVGSVPLSDAWGTTFGLDATHNGSDDGFVHLTKNGGGSWDKISDTFPKVFTSPSPNRPIDSPWTTIICG